MPMCLLELFLFNLCSLTLARTQIVKLCSADLTALGDFDVVDSRGMQGESSFHAYAVGKSSDGEAFVNAAALAFDDGTFEDLDTLSGAFDNLVVNLNGVAHAEFGQIVF